MLELLAQAPAAAGDYQGYVSIATLVAGIAAFWKWIAPRLDRMFDVVPQLRDLCERNTTSLECLATATERQAQNFSMLTRLVSAAQAAGLQCRHLVLLIEDSLMDSRLIRGLCADVIAKFKLTMIDVTSLEEALPHIPYARVVILDVSLPDADIAICQSLVTICPCPVIIHSATDYSMKDFPSAFAILNKHADSASIIEAIESAVTDSRRQVR